MSDLLALRQVSAGYGEAVVISNIDLELKQGESLAVLGRNGTGKTTPSTRSSASPATAAERSSWPAAT